MPVLEVSRSLQDPFAHPAALMAADVAAPVSRRALRAARPVRSAPAAGYDRRGRPRPGEPLRRVDLWA